jgi:hypothetical protein
LYEKRWRPGEYRMHTCCFNSRLLGTEAASNEEEILVWPAGSYYFLDRRLYSTCDPAPARPDGRHTQLRGFSSGKQARTQNRASPTLARQMAAPLLLRGRERWKVRSCTALSPYRPRSSPVVKPCAVPHMLLHLPVSSSRVSTQQAEYKMRLVLLPL